MAEPRECKRCNQVERIRGRGLCGTCHNYVRRYGNLEEYPKDNQGHQKRYDYCIDCGGHKHISGQDRCKKCYSALQRNKPGVKEKRAAEMREDRKKRPEFYREADRKRDKTEKRRKWSRDYQKKYYQENPEIFRQSSKKWEDKNPGIWAKYKQIRRARAEQLPSTLTDEEWGDIVREYHYVCAYCGCSDMKLTQEHWIPLVRGGGYTKENIVPACKRCNSRKGTKTGDEFMEQLDLEEWQIILEMIEDAC